MSGFCEAHGPYDGSVCPFPPPHTQSGSSSRPVPPAPLDDDDMVTDLRGGGSYAQQTGPTMPPGSFDEGDDETQAPSRAKRGILDIEEDEETQIGRGGREGRDDETELAEPLSPTLAMLWVKEGNRIGKFYPVRHGTMIGRKYNKEGGLILDEPKVSSSHAKFTMEGNKFFVWDLGSTNGTFVNGRKIREATLLEENDLLKIGETVFVVKLLESKPKRRASRGAETSKNTSSARKTTKK